MLTTQISPSSAATKLDANGNGTVQLGPSGGGEVWLVNVASVSVSTNVLEAQCSIFVGAGPSQQYFKDATLSGSSGDSTDRTGAAPIRVGGYVWAVWTGGDAHSIATLNIAGSKTLP